MSALPPLMRDQRRVDASHLKLLSIFHFVFAGLALLGMGFLILHYLLFLTFFDNPEAWKTNKGGPPPEQVATMMRWFYGIFAVLLTGGGLANLFSGIFIRRRQHRLFSIVVSAINCIQIPLGTVLGVFTIVVLSRDSVQEVYANQAVEAPGD